MIHMIDFYVDVLVIVVCIISIIAKIGLVRFQQKMRDETQEMRREMAAMRHSTDTMITFSLMKQLSGSHVRWYRERALRAERERDTLQATLNQKEKEHARTTR